MISDYIELVNLLITCQYVNNCPLMVFWNRTEFPMTALECKGYLGQGKKTKFPVTSYYHIYGWGVILG